MKKLDKINSQIQTIENEIYYLDRRIYRLYSDPTYNESRSLSERIKATKAKKQDLKSSCELLYIERQRLEKLQEKWYKIIRFVLFFGCLVVFTPLHIIGFEVLSDSKNKDNNQDFAIGYGIFLIGSVAITLSTFNYKKN